MTCAACGTPAHPATWHAFTATCVLCGPCARDFLAWLKRHTSRRWGGRRFYDFAEGSVRA